MATVSKTMTTILNSASFFTPDWPAPANVRALQTTRVGGVSKETFSSFNLGDHVGDHPEWVSANRVLLTHGIAAHPVWLEQVHGTNVIDASAYVLANETPRADAAFSRKAGVACVVMTADCLPVFLCDDLGTVVAVAHAGWRGLLAGVLEETVAAMGVSGANLLAYLGPAIGPKAFEVGEEVRSAFVAHHEEGQTAFISSVQGKWLADIYLLARQRLKRMGVQRVYGGTFCTFTEPGRFFSFRRDGKTGRMASLIWLESDVSPP